MDGHLAKLTTNQSSRACRCQKSPYCGRTEKGWRSPNTHAPPSTAIRATLHQPAPLANPGPHPEQLRLAHLLHHMRSLPLLRCWWTQLDRWILRSRQWGRGFSRRRRLYSGLPTGSSRAAVVWSPILDDAAVQRAETNTALATSQQSHAYL